MKAKRRPGGGSRGACGKKRLFNGGGKGVGQRAARRKAKK